MSLRSVESAGMSKRNGMGISKGRKDYKESSLI